MTQEPTRLPPRFWAKVDKNGAIPEKRPDLGPCWQWTASKNSGGYGKFAWTSRHLCYAHRLTYEALIGPIPDGLEIDHLCVNRLCCNPAHLEPVTRAVNQKRAIKTHCLRGHAFTVTNTYVDPQGRRYCRTCANARARHYRALASQARETHRV